MNKNSYKINALLSYCESILQISNGICIPVSGGSDGAFITWLFSEIDSSKTFTLFFGNKIREESWFNSRSKHFTIDISSINEDPESLRWAYVQSYCLKNKLWPIGTRNKTEETLGTYSRASCIATVLPIIYLWKSEIIELCKYIGIPSSIIESSMKPDPSCGRPIELSNIGIEKIDIFLRNKTERPSCNEINKLSNEEIDYLENIMRINNFKKELPHKGPNLD